MIDKKDFEKMADELSDFDDKREDIIKKSRDILKASKQAIYDIHRNDMNYAKKKIDDANKDINALRKEISKMPGLESVGAFNASVEEWVEAKAYFEFVKKGDIPSKKSLGVKTEAYLGGVSDLTGELARRAVAKAIEGKKDDVKKIRDAIEDIYGQFLKFNFRNSDLRKKSDSIKWNLKKAEEVLYDVAKK